MRNDESTVAIGNSLGILRTDAGQPPLRHKAGSVVASIFAPDQGPRSGPASLPEPRWSDARHSFGIFRGVRIHWIELGKAGGGTPVILLHGLSDAHFTWRSIAPELARDRLVLVPDLPGHGLSERPDASYELDWYARVMAQWIEKLDLDQLDIIGHSLGGGIAQMLLLEPTCNTRIRRIVLAAAGGLGRDVAWTLRLASVPTLVEHLGQPFMALGTRLALAHWQGVLPPGHIAELAVINAQEGTARAFARTVHDIIDWRGQRRSFFARAHEIAHLPQIAVLWGDRDSIIPIAHGRALARSVNGVQFHEIKGGGHYLHHDDPLAFLQAVHGALDTSPWPAGMPVARAPWVLCDRPVAKCDGATATTCAAAAMPPEFAVS
jgi:pimeloyl-ACP methyl ester carboxylesterase